MRDTPFCAMMGWEPTAMRSGKVTKVLLSDNKTQIPFSDELKADILKAIDNAKRDSTPVVSSIGGSAA